MTEACLLMKVQTCSCLVNMSHVHSVKLCERKEKEVLGPHLGGLSNAHGTVAMQIVSGGKGKVKNRRHELMSSALFS